MQQLPRTTFRQSTWMHTISLTLPSVVLSEVQRPVGINPLSPFARRLLRVCQVRRMLLGNLPAPASSRSARHRISPLPGKLEKTEVTCPKMDTLKLRLHCVSSADLVQAESHGIVARE